MSHAEAFRVFGTLQHLGQAIGAQDLLLPLAMIRVDSPGKDCLNALRWHRSQALGPEVKLLGPVEFGAPP